jgi:prevent-host-death family protein
MITISATQFQNQLFEYLDKVEQGETIIIERYQQEVARLIPTKPTDWREKMRLQPQLLVSIEELIMPTEDIWESYV